MARIVWGVIGCCCAAAAGCSKPATPPAKTLTSLAAVPAAAAADDEKSAMDGDQGAPAVADAEPQSADRSMPENETNHSPAGAPTELKLEGIRFVVPASWIQVKPQTYIVEAEFELPRIEGDEYDGRLTLMSSGGDPQEVMANRTAEFVQEPDHRPAVETMRIADVDATSLDVRGQWKGPTFRPVDPRDDYRMILVIIPFTPHSAFYVKLTGPRETIAAREHEFLQFVQSARLTPPGEE